MSPPTDAEASIRLAAWSSRLGPALQTLRQGIALACRSAGRSENDVHLVAVSKKQPAVAVAAALQLGQLDFGENYAQELRDKHAELSQLAGDSLPSPPRWHFIGPLQRNKVNLVVGRVALIHSVDSLALVAALGERVNRLRQTASDGTQATLVQDCLIQINIGDETQKSGCRPAELPAILDAISAQSGRLYCRGLMCIPPAIESADPGAVRPYFAQLRELRDEQQAVPRAHVELSQLSMGMSQDYAAAIAEGATLIRVGTALFGAR